MSKARDIADSTATLDVDGGTIKLDGNYPVGTNNVALGDAALDSNVSGASNTAIGADALTANTASSNTAVGYRGGYSNTTGSNLTTLGYQAGYSNTTGVSNTAIGTEAALITSTGSYNTSVGVQALYSNTTASNNTAVGYQAAYSNTTGAANVYVGYQAGYAANYAGNGLNTFVGMQSGYSVTSGRVNTLIGYGAGGSITTGSNNTILGSYNGNQGGLDIRTSSNNIVLSDGDGHPSLHCAGGNTHINANIANPTLVWQTNGVTKWYQYSQDGESDTLRITSNFTAGVKLTTSATSWAAFSDERLKDIIEPIGNAVQKVSNLRAVIGKYKTDEEGVRRAFLIAQDLQDNLPEAVDAPDADGMLSARYTDVIPLLVAAIKEQQATITALEARITALEAN